jgi:dienelactone hydrolase
VTTIGGLARHAGEQGDAALRRAAAELQRRNLEMLRKHDVLIAIGSDAYGDTSVGEALYLHELGIFTPARLLRIWTETTARAIFPTRRIGRLETGYEASFIALAGNPLNDFQMVKQVLVRVKQGQVIAVPQPGAPVAIHFPTADGGVVHADVYGRGNQVVVLAHGGRFTKESWKEQAIRLAEAGFRVIAIDFRGRGESRGGPASTGEEKELFLDVLAAVRHARESGATTVAVVGASFGGWAAAGASAEAPGEIDRLVILAGVVDEPEKLTGRKLFILSRDDVRGGGILRLPEIRDQYERAPEPKELVLLDGSAHAQFIFDTDQSERLMNEILRFLTE